MAAAANTNDTGGLKAVRRTYLYEQIVNQIRELLEQGKLKPGDQLPTERRLAEIFQVSRHCVREAIRILEQQNVVESRVGSGTYVVQSEDSKIVESLAEAIQREKDKVMEVFQLRQILEPQLAALAAENRTQEDIDELRAILDQQRKYKGKKKLRHLDASFHLILARASGNSVILSVMERINDILGESRADYHQSPARLEKSYQGHSEIMAAIVAREPDRARQAMEEHLQGIEHLVIGPRE